MRIISGNFKGKRILQPKNTITRPLKDLTKESIFNIIAHSNKFNIDFANANILDLFSGVGSFGIECLSRGVKQVIFVENYKNVLPILKKNLNNLISVSNFKILELNIHEDESLFNLNLKFDIIFLDPPYKDKNINELISKIKNSKILCKNGIIILHRHKKSADIFSPELKIIEEKNYGISKIIFISN